MPIGSDEFYGDKPQRREKWMQTLPRDVRTATDLSHHLKDALKDNKIGLAAELIATCIKTKVWETIAEYDDDNPEIKSYHPMEWCRDFLKSEPGELMKIVASPLPRPETGAAAAIELIRMVKEFDRDSFLILSKPDVLDSWQDLIKTNERRDPTTWTKVVFELEDHIVRHPSEHGGGRPKTDPELIAKAQNLSAQGKSYNEIALIMGVSKATISRWIKKDVDEQRSVWATHTHSQKRRGGDTREGIRDRLNKYLHDPDLCNRDDVKLENVENALSSMLAGGSGYAALRIAGLKKKSSPEVRLRVKQDKSLVAKRILELLKPTETRELVEELIKALKDANPNN